MIRIQNKSGDWYTLPAYYIPQRVYNFQRDSYLYRNDGEEETHLVGDNEVAPEWIEFRAHIHFPNAQALNDHVNEINAALNDVVKLEIGSSWIYLNFGYYFLSPKETQLDTEITLRFAPVLTRFGTGNMGRITWGSVDVLLGQTDVTLGD